VIGRREVRQDLLEACHALLGPSLVPLDPAGHRGQRPALEVDRAALGLLAPADEARLLEDLEVLAHRLEADVVGGGEIVDGGVTDREAGDDGALSASPPPARRL